MLSSEPVDIKYIQTQVTHWDLSVLAVYFLLVSISLCPHLIPGWSHATWTLFSESAMRISHHARLRLTSLQWSSLYKYHLCQQCLTTSLWNMHCKQPLSVIFDVLRCHVRNAEDARPRHINWIDVHSLTQACARHYQKCVFRIGAHPKKFHLNSTQGNPEDASQRRWWLLENNFLQFHTFDLHN